MGLGLGLGRGRGRDTVRGRGWGVGRGWVVGRGWGVGGVIRVPEHEVEMVVLLALAYDGRACGEAHLLESIEQSLPLRAGQAL